MKFATPEQAHSALMDAIEYELDTHGPASLAGVIASCISAYRDEDDPKPTDAAWLKAEKAYEDLEYELASLRSVLVVKRD